MITRSKLFKLAFGTIVIFSLIGWLTIHFAMDVSLFDLLQGHRPMLIQIVAGLAYGLITALLGWELVKIKYLKKTLSFFVNLIQPLKLSIIEIVLISICAGVGEELFFRGALQPFLGIWITAILFVALHGYLNPSNLSLSLYGAFMTLIIVGIGYMAMKLGLVAAMIAHTIIDVFLIYKLTHFPSNDQEEL